MQRQSTSTAECPLFYKERRYVICFFQVTCQPGLLAREKWPLSLIIYVVLIRGMDFTLELSSDLFFEGTTIFKFFSSAGSTHLDTILLLVICVIYHQSLQSLFRALFGHIQTTWILEPNFAPRITISANPYDHNHRRCFSGESRLSSSATFSLPYSPGGVWLALLTICYPITNGGCYANLKPLLRRRSQDACCETSLHWSCHVIHEIISWCS